MKKNRILEKVYGVSSMVITSVILLVCLVCQWPLMMTIIALSASIVISSPAMISLQLFIWLFQKLKVERSFIWMLLMSTIPLLSWVVAWLFADFVPGKVWFLFLLAIVSGYAGILTYAIPVAQFFNSTQYERKENDTIN